jgi:hypothetical protein
MKQKRYLENDGMKLTFHILQVSEMIHQSLCCKLRTVEFSRILDTYSYIFVVVLFCAGTEVAVGVILPVGYNVCSVKVSTELNKAKGLKSANKQTPWPLVRKRTIPTERPPLVDEI